MSRIGNKLDSADGNIGSILHTGVSLIHQASSALLTGFEQPGCFGCPMEGAEHADDEFGGFAGTTITKSKSRVSHKRKSPSTTTSKINRATTSEKEKGTGQKKRAKSHKRTLSKGIRHNRLYIL